MKYAIYLPVLFAFVCCRSSRHSNTDYSGSTVMERNENRQQTDSSTAVIVSQDSTATHTDIQEYTRTTTYYPDGAISGLQESWRNTGSSQLSTKLYTEATNTTSEKNDTTREKSATAEHLSQVINTAVDSRPVQGGSEWFGLIAGISVFLISAAIIAYVIYKRRKK
jgi:hypothetical protein